MPDYDGNTLFIKTNDLTNVVAALSEEHYKARQVPLLASVSTNVFFEDAEYFVYPPHNGVIEFVGFDNWEESQVSEVAAALSTRFEGPVVMCMLWDETDSGIYAVFEDGELVTQAVMVDDLPT